MLIKNFLGLCVGTLNILQNQSKLCDCCFSSRAPKAKNVLIFINLEVEPVKRALSMIEEIVVAKEDANSRDLVDIFFRVLHEHS